MRIWGERDFPNSTFVPLRFGLIAIPFFCMLSFSMDQAAQFKEERDEARQQMEEVLHEVTNIQKRIDVLRKQMHENEMKLHEEYRNMQQQPPIWPDTVITDGPTVFIPQRHRRSQ